MSLVSLTHAVIECGRGAWKFNNSLLQDTEYLYKIRQCIENVKHLYAATPYSPDSISDIHASELDLIIDDQLFFEMLLLEIRGQSISYSVNCKKNRLDNERVLIEKVKELECELLKSQNEANRRVYHIVAYLQVEVYHIVAYHDRNFIRKWTSGIFRVRKLYRI